VLEVPLAVEAAGGRSLQARVFERLQRDILAGRFRPGERLPSSRALARSLRVSRTTVVLAYEQLLAEGYLETRPAAGTYVALSLPSAPIEPATGRAEPTERASRPTSPGLSRWGERLLASGRPGLARPVEPPRYDFRPGRPDWSAFPRRLWRRLAARRWAAASDELTSYGQPAGYLPLRQAISEHLARSRGVRCQPDQVVVVNGSQQAFDLLARVWLDPGDAAAVEDPGYPEAATALRAYGVYVLPVPVDANGLVVEQLPLPDAPQAPRLVYVTPSHQFPTGAVLGLRRRLALLEWAEARDALVIEDDYDSEFRYEGRPLESLQGLDAAGRVAYVGSFSTALFPPLRVGYAVLPPRLVEPFVAAKWLADRQTATIDQQVLADFIADGHFARHLRRMGRLYRERRATLLAALAAELDGLVRPGGSGAGLHLVAWLRDGLDEAELTRVAAAQGVGVYPLRRCRLGGPGPGGLLLGYAALDEQQIKRGVAALGRAAASLAAASEPGSSIDRPGHWTAPASSPPANPL
jgi:GntR family transcriptional regulator/MocR family aminotransferase